MSDQNQALEFKRQQLEKHIQKMEELMYKYHNVIREASSLNTLDMGQILLPLMQQSLNELQQTHHEVIPSPMIMQEDKQK